MEKRTTTYRFYLWLTVISIGILIGLYGAVIALTKGHLTMGTFDHMPWGILISTYGFFALTALGIGMITFSGHVFGVKRYQLISERAIFLAIITLLCAFIAMFFELGRPVNMIYFLISPNFGSAIWWMGLFYPLYLIVLILGFLFLRRADEAKVKYISIIGLILAILTPGTIGAIFGFSLTRPYFAGAFMPIFCIVIALVSGAAILAFVTIITSKVAKKEMLPELSNLITVDLGKLLGLVLAITIFFTIWKNLTGLYSPEEVTMLAYRYMLFGPAGWWYWGIVILMGLVIPFILILNPGTRNVNGILVASTLVLIGMFVGRHSLVIGGQVVPLPVLWQPKFLAYSPTFVEIAIVILAFALGALLYTLGSRIFKLEEAPKVSGV